MASKHRVTVGEELRYDSDLQGLRNLSNTYAPKGLLTVNAADPQFGATRDHVQINAAIAAVKAAGGGKVLVRKADGPWSIGRRVAGQWQQGGLLIDSPNIELEFDGTVLNLTDNAAFIRIGSTLGSAVTITADTSTSATTLTVSSSASFTVGQWVFVRLGQAAYDANEPDFWLYAKVSALPDATHVSLDRPVGYAMSVAGTPSTSQRSVTPISTLVENVKVSGHVQLVNPMSGSANAEMGVWVQHARNIEIESVGATDPGAGAVNAQFTDGLRIGAVKVASSVAQNGQASKGGVTGFAECRGVTVDLIEAEGFERSVVTCEARSEGVSVSKIVARNTSGTRVNNTAGLILLLGNSSVSVGAVHLVGNGSFVYDDGGNAGCYASIAEFYSYTADPPSFADLGIVTSRFRFSGSMYVPKPIWRKTIPLTAGMSLATTTLPAGYLRGVRAYVSSTTGITSLKLGSTAALSPDLKGNLVAGQSAALGGYAAGFSGTASFGYETSADTGKRLVVSTDSTVPSGALLAIEVDYFGPFTANVPTDAMVDSLLSAPNTYAVLQRPRTMAAPATLAKAFRSDRSAYNVSPTSLKRTRAAAAAAFAGTGRLDICCIGTSVTAGQGATTKVQSWPSKLQASLVARGFPDGGSGLIVSQSNIGSTTDARVTLGTGWTAFSAATTPLAQGTSTGGSITFADTKPSTIIDVYYVDYFTFGFSWTVDGSAQTDVITTNTTTLKKVTVSGLSSANHTVVITPKSGTDGTHPVYIVGVSFRNVSGVAVHNLGIGACTTASMKQSQAYTPWNISKFIAPQLTFWESGFNDGTPPLYSGYSADVQAAITGITGAGSDFIIVGEHPSGTGTRPDAQTLPVLYGLADTNDLALVDMNDRLISWASLDALGLGYDTDSLQVHLTAAGYGEYARAVDQALAL